MPRTLRLAFLHPDLGLGGAERVVVDAALEMQARGHHVTIYTLHHDPDRCFDETRNGTLRVVAGRRRDEDLGTRWRGPIMIWRMARLAVEVLRRERDLDVVFCDLVAHVVPLLRLRRGLRVFYYCHFPDCLLVHRDDRLYRMYRWSIDYAEELGVRAAHRVAVNSRFTAAAFRRVFPRVRTEPELLYPGVPEVAESAPATRALVPTIVCLNRFAPDKNLELAIEAVAALRHHLEPAVFATVHLILAGSCDPRLPEQPATLERLKQLAQARGVASQVSFRTSITDEERHTLLAAATCAAYTPAAEHFGLGPLEAMAAGVPVVAVDAGGVRETVRSGETGLLCPPTAEAFAAAFASLIQSPQRARELGAAGRAHVADNFSRRVFGARLEALLQELAG